MFEGRRERWNSALQVLMLKCHVYEHLLSRILTDSSKFIFLNSVKQIMSQITFEKVNAWSRFFVYIVNERASFALHAHSFESPIGCQLSYCANVRAGAKKWKEEGVGRKGNACPQTPRFWKTPLEISRFVSFVNWQLVNTIDNEQITRFVKFTFFPKTRSTRLQNCNKKNLYDKRRLKL